MHPLPACVDVLILMHYTASYGQHGHGHLLITALYLRKTTLSGNGSAVGVGLTQDNELGWAQESFTVQTGV